MNGGGDAFRAFAAIVPGPEERAIIAQYLDRAGVGSWRCRPVRPMGWHVGVRFLGMVDAVTRDRFVHDLAAAIDPSPFPVVLGGLGAFPRRSKASVVWLAVDDPTGSLASVAETAEHVARELGLTPEERPYRPHLSVARCRPQWDASDVAAAAEPLDLRFVVDEIGIYRSHLGDGPARYERVDAISLAG